MNLYCSTAASALRSKAGLIPLTTATFFGTPSAPTTSDTKTFPLKLPWAFAAGGKMGSAVLITIGYGRTVESEGFGEGDGVGLGAGEGSGAGEGLRA